jgi:hypothetical protein
MWIALAAGFAGAGGLTTWQLTRPSSHAAELRLVAPMPIDAGVVEPKGTLELDSIPTGAMVTIADHVLGAAPRSARVSSGVRIHVKLDLKGYVPYEDDLSVETGKTIVLHPRLSPAPAVLHVETTPPGATVALAGQPLGTTPLSRQVPTARGAEVALAKAGYESIKLKVNLTAGEQTDVSRELRELQKFGVVLVSVVGAAEWGYVFFRGKSLGQNYTMASGQTPFKLPVGRQELRIEHPRAGAKTVTVEVSEHGPTRVTVPL